MPAPVTLTTDSERTAFFDECEERDLFILDGNGWAFVAGAEDDGPLDRPARWYATRGLDQGDLDDVDDVVDDWPGGVTVAVDELALPLTIIAARPAPVAVPVRDDVTAVLTGRTPGEWRTDTGLDEATRAALRDLHADTVDAIFVLFGAGQTPTYQRTSGTKVAEMTVEVTLDREYQQADWEGTEPAYWQAGITQAVRTSFARTEGDFVVPPLDTDCDPDNLLGVALAVLQYMPVFPPSGSPETVTLAVDIYVDDDGEQAPYSVIGSARVTSSTLTARTRDLLLDGAHYELDPDSLMIEAIITPLPQPEAVA